MRNQTSFRLTTTLLPTDMTAKTTTVINKVDSDGNKFYPTFTEETVVLTNDDRTVMETTRATCTDGVLTFVKRGLSDDASETQVANRKLTRNPGTLVFITAGAGDWIDKDDNITWSGNQTYSGNLTSQGTATYAGRLITQKGVEYPHFNNVEALEAYNAPFGGMFAVVDSTGELYRYNAVTEEWSVVTTATPTNPEMADDETIGTVRIATQEEFEAGTDTGASGESLVATPSMILGVSPDVDTKVFVLTGEEDTEGGQAILDFYLSGKVPIIKGAFGSSVRDFFYLDQASSSRLTFVRTLRVSGSYGLYYDTIYIRYSSGEVTGVEFAQKGIATNFYFSSIDLSEAQDLLDAYGQQEILDVKSDYTGDMLNYYIDKRVENGGEVTLTLSTLGGGKHINIKYDDLNRTVISMNFS